MGKSNDTLNAAKVTRPEKPSADFPLFAHGNGQWAKKIRKRIRCFGPWATTKNGQLVLVDDVDASARKALERFNREWPYLKDGREVPADIDQRVQADDVCTMKQLCNEFWRSKRNKLEAGELSQRSFRDYEQTTDLLIDHFGRDRRVDDIKPHEFGALRLALVQKGLGVHALKNTINRCRVVFKFAYKNRMIDREVNYGDEFNRPSAKELRKARNDAGERLFERDEILSLLNAADVQLKAMILLGINCGFGNTDVASLPQSAVDLDNGWIDFPRPKTEIPRRCKLWPETVSAIRDAIAARPKAAAKDDADCVFLTYRGNRWVRINEERTTDADGNEVIKVVPIDALSQRFGKLLRKLKINGRRGLGIYTLRHTFQTIGGDAKDPDAVSAIMGHVDSSMSGLYRERIADERLEAISDCVRRWLFRNPPENSQNR